MKSAASIHGELQDPKCRCTGVARRWFGVKESAVHQTVEVTGYQKSGVMYEKGIWYFVIYYGYEYVVRTDSVRRSVWIYAMEGGANARTNSKQPVLRAVVVV